MTRLLLAVFAIFLSHSVKAQFSDNFTDGNFSENPAWQGNTDSWIVNASQQLQSNNTTANSSFCLSTASTLAIEAQWEFYTQLAFSTSGTNYADVYVIASQSNLTNTTNTGYFIRIGNTDDEVSLYKKNADGSATKIIDGTNGRIAGSNNTIAIKLTRDATNNWKLYSDITGTGNNFQLEGNTTESSYTSSAYFGILVRQSTASFFQKHYFDDIKVSHFEPDVIPSTVSSVTAASNNTLEVLFSEAVNASSVQANAFDVNNGVGQPLSAMIDAANPALIKLSFAKSFTPGIANSLTIIGIKDVEGNTMASTVRNFTFYIPQRYDIVISEIMADPTPTVGLPDAEWIELTNTSPVSINLQGYRIGKPGSSSGTMSSIMLQPDSSIILCANSQSATMSAFGRTVSVTSFPSLGNDGDLLILYDANGNTMHAVQYSSSWYQNSVKANGGWSLEMIDTYNACSNENWKASVDSKGGTPGRKNSIAAINKDATPPQLLRAYAPDNLHILLYFNEGLDSSTAAAIGSYNLSNYTGSISVAAPQMPLFSTVLLSLSTPLDTATVYTISCSKITDCQGNEIEARTKTQVGLAAVADSMDLIINEILFNPKPLGADYVELYNRSNKIIDAASIFIANRSSTTGALSTPVALSAEHYLIFPHAFMVITSSSKIVAENYLVKQPDALLEISSMPSFPDDKGWAAILNQQGRIIDELAYSIKWHFALVDNDEGIALERIDYNRPTNEPANWTSAASSAGFGTPTYQNSQYHADLQPQGEITINPKLFSPDNDGIDDFAFVQFRFPEPGYTANVTIFDAAGRPVKVLQRNTTVAATGSFRWDGLNDKQQIVPAGTYIIYTDIFNLKGQKRSFKNTMIVARKL